MSAPCAGAAAPLRVLNSPLAALPAGSLRVAEVSLAAAGHGQASSDP